MDTFTLTWDHLAAVLCLDSDHTLEPSPQPIRGTPSLTVIIPFDQYLRFLEVLPKDFKYLYKTPAKALEDPVASYYFDVARAVGKELYYCYKYHMRPTHFRHRFDGPTLPKPQFDWRNSEDKFRYYLEQREFPIAPTGIGVAEWAYACSLVECSQTFPSTMWNIE